MPSDGLHAKNLHAIARALGELPPPDPQARAASERLADLIGEAMAAAGGRLTFARFMELALYAPGLGYYSGGSRKFGADGDFVTAPEVAPLFSRCLARQCVQVLDALGGGGVLEFGAGSGVMAADLLAELEVRGCLPESYGILEVSGELRERQRTVLERKVPHLLGRVRWLERWPDAPLRGVVLANEVLDAMPVHRFRIEEGEVRELYVTRGEGGFGWESGPSSTPLLTRRVEMLRDSFGLADGYESEVNLAAEGWVRALSGALSAGAAFIIDYGFPRHEFYHPQRTAGTLMCHYRHRAHDDPLVLPGLQDITAHVDFTAIAEAAGEAGLSVSGFASQGNFLLANGLMELAAEVGDPRAQLEVVSQVKRLTLPCEMGELFKVLALTRGLPLALQGFSLRDDRFRL